MPDEAFDFDPTESDLRVGLELEYPSRDSGEEKYVHRGRSTTNLSRRASIPARYNAEMTYDGTVGLEVVSNVLDLEDAPNWHADAVEYVEEEYNTPYQPVGLMRGGNTAGLHIHISRLSDRQARDLYEISQTSWAKVLFCSSIANGSNGEAAWPVFRGGRYCQMEYNNNRYSCLNARGNGHYEWRLPEPMDPEHLEVVVRFLRLFEQDTDLAIQYAQERLDEGDDRITSIKRAEAAGMDFDAIPDVRREPAPEDPEDFYNTVADEWAAPEIYQIELEGRRFYLLQSDLQGTFNISGVDADLSGGDEVLWADSLEPVNNAAVSDDVRRAFQRRESESSRQTEATEELKKIIKKKKGKA